MSFSNKIREELAFLDYDAPRHCSIAEAYGFIRNKSVLKYKNNKYFLSFDVDNYFIGRRIFFVFKILYNPKIEIKKTISISGRENFLILIKNQEDIGKILKSMEIEDIEDIKDTSINNLIIKNECCKESYIRSCFLTNGTMVEPKKSYHLEFVFKEKTIATEIKDILDYFSIISNITKRRNNYILYIKEAESISIVLNIIGAHKKLLEYENIRVMKDVGNNINRIINFETANLEKTIKASVTQVDNIHYIMNSKGLSYLPEPLREIAVLRLENVNASYKEIGEMLDPPISKSGVNHRLRRINKIADELRRD